MKNLLAKRVKKNNKGFTLVELIIVIAIIAILVAVLAPNYVKYVERSRWSADQNTSSELYSEVKTALVEAQDDDGYTPADFTITMSKTGTSASTTAPKQVTDALTEADKDWQKGVVKHKQSHTVKKSTGNVTIGNNDNFYIIYTAASDKLESGWSPDGKNLQ